MTAAAADYEKLGLFYLGREVDPQSESLGEPLLYDAKDLVTHGAVLGMTGSGKTGLCIALLEEAAMDSIPAVVIDPKGDISNLLLSFPDLSPASFRPWISEDEAARNGATPDEHAAAVAAAWKDGLAEWGQSRERIAAFRERADVTVFTPGSLAGIPVSILSSLAAPPPEVMEDRELAAERIESASVSLLGLAGIDADPMQSPEAALLGSIFSHAWSAGRGLTLESLIVQIQKPPFDKVGVMDLESVMPQKDRQALALRINSLLASPGFGAWLEGPPLDISSMLHTPEGKPRISVISIAHLSDAERMFAVSLVLSQTLGWMRSQSGTASLRAILYMDEVFGFLPPVANPPSKRPLLTLLKQGRAFGLGCLLATQNPVDLDYKALSNIGTWFLGRLQTERDKLRVLDGLQGAAGEQGAAIDRSALDRLLSDIAPRTFVMRNIHESELAIFKVRWVMSYLAGPLTRDQIESLMAPKRHEFAQGAAGSMRMPELAPAAPAASARPAVGAGVAEMFARAAVSGADVTCRPYLFRRGTVHFTSSKANIDESREAILANPILKSGVDWDRPLELPAPPEFDEAPPPGVSFAELPGFAMNAASYRDAESDFAEWLYRNQRAEVFSCPALKAWSQVGESEADFRMRLAHASREARDAAVEKMRERMDRKLASLESRLRTAEGQLARAEASASAAKMRTGASILGGVLGAVMGRKMRIGSLSRAATVYQREQSASVAEKKVADIENDLAELRAEAEAESAEIAASFEPHALELERESIRPTRSGVRVEDVSLLWLPFTREGEPAW